MNDQRMPELARDLGDAELAGLLLLARQDLVELPPRTAQRHLEAIFTVVDAMAAERTVPARAATVSLVWATRLAATAAGLAVVLTSGLAVTGSLPASAQEFFADSAARIGITLPSPALDARNDRANDAPGSGPAAPQVGEPGRSGDAPRGSDVQRPARADDGPGERRGQTDDEGTAPQSEREPAPPPGGEPEDPPVTGDPGGGDDPNDPGDDGDPGDTTEVEGPDEPSESEKPRVPRETAPGQAGTTPSEPKTSASPKHDDPSAADGATDAPSVITGSTGADLDSAAADGGGASDNEDDS